MNTMTSNNQSYQSLEKKLKPLLLLPILSLIIVFGVAYSGRSGITISSLLQPQQLSEMQSETGLSMAAAETETSCGCPSGTAGCSVIGNAVLGGVDVVQYHTAYKLDDGSYNESMTGEEGSSTYSSTHNGFKFYFVSNENKKLFDKKPEKYLPQYGGFCSWGITGEYCPPYPWDKDCLGPSGNWGHWTIHNEKLYFFLFELAKSKFVDDPDTYVAAGDSRWLGWFNESDNYFSTNCYVK